LSQKYSINKMTNNVEKMSTSFNSHLKRIGYNAFSGCNLSGKLVLPDNSSLTSIDGSAFSYNAITSVDIPKSVTSLGSGVFQNNQISSVKVSTSSEASAFYNNPITNLTLTDCNSYCERVSSTSTINQLTINSGEIRDYAFNDSSIQNLTLGEGVTSIGAQSFYNNQISELTIPSSVTSIGSSAFSGNQISELIIPSNVTSIGTSAFSGNQISELDLSNATNLQSIGGSAFLGNQISELTIPSNVTSIEFYAFKENQISELIIPSSVVSIGNNSFTSQKNSNGQTIPINKLVIEEYKNGYSPDAFDNITNLTINGGSIIDRSFENKSIQNLTLGEGVTSLGSYAFKDNQISELTVPSNVTNIGIGAFSEQKNSNGQTIPINEVVIEEYKNEYSPDVFDNIKKLTINSGSIQFRAFYNKSIQNLTLGEGVTSIGNQSFYGNQISKLTIPSSVTTIGEGAFYGNQICILYLNNAINLESIGEYAFYENQIFSVYLTSTSGLKSIGNYAFYENQMNILTIPSSVTNIGSYAFANNPIEIINIERSNESWLSDVTKGTKWYNTALSPIFHYNYVISSN
ncbi:MAG: leucine-rich repeat domain-containing protein, partial [bacterium]|nr:leucine-rich repeat domain-containing protein [bacterium]